MVERIRVSLVHCDARAANIGYHLCNSSNYKVKLNVMGEFNNPMLSKLSRESGGSYYFIDTDNKENIHKIVEKCNGSDLAVICNETPLIYGLGNALRNEYKDMGVIGKNKEFVLEGDKHRTRLIIEEIYPQANPVFYFIEPKKNGWKKRSEKAIKELSGKVAIKPIEPKFGKGVIVEGFDFQAKDAYKMAVNTAEAGSFLIEENIECEEWSGQYAVDSKLHIENFPATRDFKRGWERDKGPNTGGAGFVTDNSDDRMILPFMKRKEFGEGSRITRRITKRLSKLDSYEDGAMTGIAYPAFAITGKGNKVFEINDRLGNPEGAGVLDLIENDLVDVFLGMVGGSTPKFRFKRQAVAGICAMPLTYGGYMNRYTGSKEIKWDEKELSSHSKFFPGSIDLKDNGEMHIMESRGGIMVSRHPKLETVLKLVNADIKKIDGPFRYRTDNDMDYMKKCIRHADALRRKYN